MKGKLRNVVFFFATDGVSFSYGEWVAAGPHFFNRPLGREREHTPDGLRLISCDAGDDPSHMEIHYEEHRTTLIPATDDRLRGQCSEFDASSPSQAIWSLPTQSTSG